MATATLNFAWTGNYNIFKEAAYIPNKAHLALTTSFELALDSLVLELGHSY